MSKKHYLVPEQLVLGIIDYLRKNRPMVEVEDAVNELRSCRLITQKEDNGNPADRSAAELRS